MAKRIVLIDADGRVADVVAAVEVEEEVEDQYVLDTLEEAGQQALVPTGRHAWVGNRFVPVCRFDEAVLND